MWSLAAAVTFSTLYDTLATRVWVWTGKVWVATMAIPVVLLREILETIFI
jgi:hypothetical protein